MAGLGFDNKFPRVIAAKPHSIIDYIHAGTNFLVGALFHRNNSRAAYSAYALGASVLANALMTDYPLGVFRLYNFKVHGILDYGVAASSAVLPVLLGFADEPEAAYFYAQGGGETVIAGITDYEDDSGSSKSRHELESLGQRYRVRKIA
jgi:hypothetical protein